MTCESVDIVRCRLLVRAAPKLSDLMKFGVSIPSLKRIGRIGPKETVGMGVELGRRSALGRDDGEPESVARDQMGRRG